MSKPVARIIKREYADGSRYISQRWVPKFRWFGIGKKEYHWESFKLTNSDLSGIHFQTVSTLEEKFSYWKDKENAEFFCEEWIRYLKPDQTIKTWTVEK
jgi:hypothetical protein